MTPDIEVVLTIIAQVIGVAVAGTTALFVALLIVSVFAGAIRAVLDV